MQSIGLINWSGHGNLGDNAVAKILEEELSPHFIVKNLGEDLKNIQRQDGYVLGGGTLICPGSLFLAKLPEPQKTIGFGLGVSDNWQGEWLEQLKNLKALYVRDQFSFDKLKGYGIQNILSYDPICLYQPYQGEGNKIMMNLMIPQNPEKKEFCLEKILETTQEYYNDPREKEFFALSPNEDVETMTRLGFQPKLYTDARELLKGMSQASLIIATRLHASVLAWMSGKPYRIIPYDQKLIYFQEYIKDKSLFEIQSTLKEHLKEVVALLKTL